ncbi:MAG: hypothetical protein ACTHNW_09790 [Mucilaginibacter sp.]
MKKLLSAVLFIAAAQFSKAQTKPSPLEQRLADSLCASVSRVDVSKATNAAEAEQLYTQCINNYLDLLQQLSEERHLDMNSTPDMEKLGVDLAKDLMVMKCSNFMKLATVMAEKRKEQVKNTTSGTFKRIELKGFNYIVINDAGYERSFLWLEQFPNSEKFMNSTSGLIGKKIKISWHELEVYLPQAKGYYKVKEITGIEFL